MQAQVQDQENTAVVTPARAGASDSTSIALARQSGVGKSCNSFQWAEVKKTSSAEFTLSVAVGTNRGQKRAHSELWLARSCCSSSCRGQTAAHTRPLPPHGTPCTSGRDVPNNDSTRAHHGCGLLHSGCAPCDSSCAPTQLWQRPCQPHLSAIALIALCLVGTIA